VLRNVAWVVGTVVVLATVLFAIVPLLTTILRNTGL